MVDHGDTKGSGSSTLITRPRRQSASDRFALAVFCVEEKLCGDGGATSGTSRCVPGEDVGAYQQQCGSCSLRHEELLDAAPIVPHSELHGEPVVSNGMPLCRLHHAAVQPVALRLQMREEFPDPTPGRLTRPRYRVRPIIAFGSSQFGRGRMTRSTVIPEL